MAWYHNAIFYELYPRAFMDGNNDGYGDFIGLRDKLDYLKWLGVDCLWITPIFPSPLRDDGYDVASFYSIAPIYGLMEDFILTVQAIKAKGMRVILDLVLNHTSDQHPWFQEARRSKDSPFRDYYVWSETPDKYQEARIIFLDTEESNWAYGEMTGEYYWHRFYSHQPDLNYDNPKVHEEMLNIARFWLKLGVDGFRVDAVPYLYEREGTNCENLPETHDFIKKLRKMVDEEFPGALLLAEANQWAHDLLPYFGDGDGDEFQMCFHFPVMPRLYMALAKKDRTSVVDILKNTPKIPKNCQWATFLRNHDELTLEMVTEEDRQFMWDFYAPDMRQRLNLGIRRRLAPLMDNDRRKIELLHSLLLTLPGAPVLYYGDEIGMGDNIALFDRNGVRTPMQWSADENGGFSRAPIENLYAPPIMGPEYGFSTVNVESQLADPTSLLNTLQRMITTRKAESCFGDGELIWLEELPVSTLCFWRQDANSRLLIQHNLSDESIVIPMPAGKFKDILTGEVAEGQVTLAPYGYHWFKPLQ